MKYMVFIIYMVVVVQFINSKPIDNGNGVHRGCNFYKISGILNMVGGFLGMSAVNILLRDKGIIPPFFVWSALIGFAIVTIYGLYCIYKMMVSAE